MKPYIAPPPPALDGAACRGTDINIWFEPEHTETARQICALCPARNACYSYAITLPIDTEGIYAGLTQAELHKPRRAANNPTPIRHGTTAGYHAHKRQNQPPCDDCRTAHTQYQYARRQHVNATTPIKLREANIIHGTHSGAVQHRNYGIPLCDACRKAKNEYMREYMKNKRARQAEQ